LPDVICLDPTHSTTRMLVAEEHLLKREVEDMFESVLFLPECKGRQGEGGLRTQGYFKANQAGKPLITVITVVFNGEQFLEETIQSVINQTYDNIEYIVVDGVSTDGSLAIIKKYEDRIDYWISEPDEGIYVAMNKGWVAASSESFILYLGAGDKILSLPHNMGSFATKDVPYGNVQVGSRAFAGRIGFVLKCNNTLHHQALLVHKSFHPTPPFDINFEMYADFDFNQRLLKWNANFVYAPEFRSYALPGGVSSNKDYVEILRVVRKNFGLLFSLFALSYLVIAKVLRKRTADNY